MTKYSYDEVYNALLEVMSSKPKEYRYDYREGCRYFEWVSFARTSLDYTKPSCIVGHVLALLGEESIVIASNNTTDMIVLLPTHQELFDQKSILLLCKAQEYQDRGETWHHAVHEAEIYVRGQWDS